MKERTFYVINLDNKRIGIILTLLTVMLSSFFLLGMSVGKKKATAQIAEKPDGQEMVSERYELPGIEKKDDSVKITEDMYAKPAETIPKKEAEVVDLNSAYQEKSRVSGNKITATFPGTDIAPKKEPKKAALNKTKKAKIANPSKEPVAGDTYTVQLGAFRHKKEAMALKKDLIESKKGLKPYVQKEGALYCVRIGKSKDKKELKKIIARLGQSFQTLAMIIRSKKA